jgi:ribosomal-protein-serine acetyltransferase
MFTCKISEELELRILEVRHADALYQLVNKNREHLAKWLPWVDKTTKVEDTIAYIEFELSRFAKNNGFSCGIFYQNEIVGCIGLHGISWGNKLSSIGYWLFSYNAFHDHEVYGILAEEWE